MVQIIEQTPKEKMKMYMKLSKKELAQMLIAANDVITRTCIQQVRYENPPGTWNNLPGFRTTTGG